MTTQHTKLEDEVLDLKIKVIQQEGLLATALERITELEETLKSRGLKKLPVNVFAGTNNIAPGPQR